MDIGGEVPGYELHERVGRGASAIVWRGVAVSAPERLVAVKHVEVASDPASISAVQREAEVLGRLSHPSVLGLLAVVRTARGAALVTPYAPGGSLASRLARVTGGLPPGEVADLGARLASALSATHTAGIVHRDVKPANVLFDAEDQPLLGDFGTALLAGEPREVIGTAEYLDPGVAAGRPADASSDLYALGVTLYEALSGTLPFAGSSARQTIAAADRGVHVPLGELMDAPPSLTDAVEAAMARHPEDRPATAGGLAARLDEARREIARSGRADATPTVSIPPVAPEPPRPAHPRPAPGQGPGPGPGPRPEPVAAPPPPPIVGSGPVLPTSRDLDNGRSGTVRYGPARPRPRSGPVPAGTRPRLPRWALVLAAIAIVVVPLAIVGALLLDDDDPVTGSAWQPAPECDDVTVPVSDGELLLADVEGRGCSVQVAWDGAQLAVPSSDGGIDRYDLAAQDGDVLLFGDWTCDGRDSPALYRPDDGRIFTFDRLVASGQEASVAGEASGTVGGDPHVVTDDDGCDHIEVDDPDAGAGAGPDDPSSVAEVAPSPLAGAG